MCIQEIKANKEVDFNIFGWEKRHGKLQYAVVWGTAVLVLIFFLWSSCFKPFSTSRTRFSTHPNPKDNKDEVLH